MIQLSPRGQAIYQLLTLAVLLALVYALSLSLSASYALPSSPLANIVSQTTVDAIMQRAFWLALLTGMLATGALLAGEGLSARSARWLSRGWRFLALGGLLASPVVSELALSLVFSLAALLAAQTLHRNGSDRPGRNLWIVWRLSLLLLAIGLPLPALTNGAAAAAARAFQLHIAGGLAALSMAYWLFGRFSRVELAWAHNSLRICTLLLLLGGGLITVGPLRMPAPVAMAAAPLVLLCEVIVASHWYRALSHRDDCATLAPHWLALATLFLVISGGIAGPPSIQPGLQEAMRGTDLPAAHDWLAGCLPLFALLALVNQTASDLRGDNRRVTGYVPFWLLGFGAALASLCQAGRGLLQVYLRAEASAELLLPLSVLWMICLFSFAAGMLVYALGYAARLPKIRVLEN